MSLMVVVVNADIEDDESAESAGKALRNAMRLTGATSALVRVIDFESDYRAALVAMFGEEEVARTERQRGGNR